MELKIGNVAVSELVRVYGTPLYVYDKEIILERIAALKEAFPSAHICYAIKANSNPALLKLIASQGLGADCSNKTEIELAEMAGFNIRNSVCTLISPTDEDLQKAIQSRITVNLNDVSLLPRLLKWGTPSKLAFRINPGFGAGKFPGIVCGGADSKFGVSMDEAIEGYKHAKRAGVSEFGIHMMTGSCVLDEKYFDEAAKVLATFAKEIELKAGIRFSFVDIGGGFGVPYDPSERPLNIKTVGQKVSEVLAEWKIVLEPGRYIIAEAGTLLTSVTARKEKIVFVDAGMTNLIRPALYGAYHSIVASNATDETEEVKIVGPICESTDVFTENRTISRTKEGDILAIQVAGAYGFAMSSQYNGSCRPAEVVVSKGTHKLIRERETTADVIRNARY